MEGSNIFSNISKMADSQVVMATEEGHPIHGLKKSLIRLIGNMSYCNKAIQDQVRANENAYTSSMISFKTRGVAATICASGQHRFAELFLIKLIKVDSKIGFEMSLIVDEAVRGRCASFMILTATVSEIFGEQTNSSILVTSIDGINCIFYF